MIDIEKERAAFESAAPGFNHQRYMASGEYRSSIVEDRWQGWQLRAATQPAQELRKEVQPIPAKTGALIDQILAYGAACTCMDDRATAIMAGIKQTLAGPALTDEARDAEWAAICTKARALYSQWVGRQNIHSNCFPGWSELTSSQRAEWVEKARIDINAGQAVKD